MTVLITGAAGFIGFHTARRLLARGEKVVGVDNMNDYYDVSLKEARLAILQEHENFHFERADIAEKDDMAAVAERHPDVTRIINLAAQAGVRYSLINPHAYTRTNIEGHLVMMEMARNLKQLDHFVYASSSSVYGTNTDMPFSVKDRVDTPVSLYAATKKSMEMMGHAYAHLFRLPMTGLRFFTVYGPWGRPDMALFIFAKKIIAGEPIPVFNQGNMRRDFTYIDDIVSGVIACLDTPPKDDTPGTAPARVYNIGNHQSESLMDYIGEIEKALGKKATLDLLPMQDGDVPETYADITETERDFGYRPTTSIREGIPKFINWYKEFYGV